MSDIKKDQIGQWLKKLERESWQLELLVSAFTIFLLIQAIQTYDVFLADLPFEYNLSDSILSIFYVFLALLAMSLEALSLCLIFHLMLRGFWIGTIGLRSVQSKIDFSKLKYSDYFSQKLKKRIVSLDQMVIMLDEMCSVIFSFSFLVISVLLAFGLYLLFLGFMAVILGFLNDLANGWMDSVLAFLSVTTFLLTMLTGLIYMIDYFTLGFFKKFKTLSKIYYPIYKFYGFITLSIISRSIYYYLISKFSKKKIRTVYLFFGLILFLSSITEFDQYQYHSEVETKITMQSNYYDNLRPMEASIAKIAIPSNVISGSYLQLFLRYDPKDNEFIKMHCPEYEPLKNEGLNLAFGVTVDDDGFSIEGKKYDDEDAKKLLKCQSSIYKLIVNDSIYDRSNFYFFTHPKKEQKGLMTMLSTSGFIKGENILEVKKAKLDSAGVETLEDYAFVPFWYEQ